ncbi:MAG: amidohydrolase family protein [Abditibacteriota bacterium]|nr:amidohydrolase family protein [Abditibacteriota bacterium]
MNIIDLNTVYGTGVASTYNYSIEDLESSLLENGISKAFTLNSSGIFYNFSLGNEITIKELSGKDMFYPVATINPGGFFSHEASIENLKLQGFKAIKLFPEIQGWKIDNIVLKEILELNNQVGLPIIINTSLFGEISSLSSIYNYDFPLICGGVSFENTAEFVVFAKKNPKVFVECGAFKSHYVLNKVIYEIGADRVLFGSNSPQDLPKVSIDFILKSKISDTDKEKILSLNILNII